MSIPYQFDFALLLGVSIAIDIAAAVAVLCIPRGPLAPRDAPPRITMWHIVLAAMVVGILFIAKCIIGLTIGVHLFGFMNLAYCTAAISAPAVGILVLAVPALRRRLTLLARLFACASLTAIPMFIWCSIIEPNRIVFERHDLPIAGVTEPITVVVLADVQSSRITAREQAIAERVNALLPDLILIPGDLWQDRGSLGFEPLSDAVAAEFRDWLASLRAAHGVYFAPGNAEKGYDWRPLIESAGVTCLENEIATTTINAQEFVIAGTEWSPESWEFQQFIRAFESESDFGPTILMSHTPDVLYDLEAYYDNLFWTGKLTDYAHRWHRTDLIVAGHTHGGQVVVPFLGPLITFSHAPDTYGAGGLFSINTDTHLCVSRGIGMERGQAPRLRFCCPPEVTVLMITAPDAAP